MERFGHELEKRKAANAKVFQKAFGVTNSEDGKIPLFRTIRAGGGVTIFTVGYEKRSAEGLMSLLRNAGVEVLADIREKPMSRVADFRSSALRGFCEHAGIVYESWPELGSTEEQRDDLKESGDFGAFERTFRKYIVKSCEEPLRKLAEKAKQKPVALLCYERLHEECHRSVVADLIADRLNAGVIAI
jgi:uncharacterized protein (DUF488 family)